MFTAERARTPIRFLSGGERNRVLLAKLFTRPANVIVLDEPTNDLDAETLEILESRLVDFPGTVLVVSHDRDFLDHVVTSTLVFEEQGVREYDGGYSDWVRQKRRAEERQAEADKKLAKTDSGKRASSGAGAAVLDQGVRPRPGSDPLVPKKLSFKEQRELEQLPGEIEKLESAIAERHASMALPEFYKQAKDVIAAAQQELADLEAKQVAAYARWEELESRRG